MKIKKWEPDEFDLETGTVWSFPSRGQWATHDGKWRGNWSPYIPRNVILRYSAEGDWLLDQFAGGGTTLVEAKLLNRNIIGVDVNKKAIDRCFDKLNFCLEDREMGLVYLENEDARDLSFIESESIDLICTHPPYSNIIKYSESISEDLSTLSYKDFLEQMEKVASESYRVLKKDKICAFMIGDIRKKGKIVHLGFDSLSIFEGCGFKLKEIVIKKQHNTKMYNSWVSRSKKHNFLLIDHEYLFILQK